VEIGEKVRQLRIAKNLKIRQLSELVECTPSLISQLERGKTDPSISMLKKIARALDANIVDFFMEGVAHEDIVTGMKDRVDIQLKRWDARIQSLVKNVTNKKMQPFYTVIKPGGGSHGLYSHEGEEFGFLLSGRLELILNDRIHTVRQNESFYFSSQIPHNWGNTGKEDAVVIWVITPPTF
jgi:transcriptional regulator with XRE-family HTH domain